MHVSGNCGDPTHTERCEHVADVCLDRGYTAREFTYESVRELDKAISTHLRLYQRVPQYSGRLRPKHHFLTHTAMDILNFGPPRQFWCFGYEAKNQAVKRAANASNFRDVVKSAAKTLAMQAAKSILDRNSGS